jgi:hypothetical protein
MLIAPAAAPADYHPIAPDAGDGRTDDGEACKQQGIARVVDEPTHAWRGCRRLLESG